jgi:hypothetical protein
MDRTNDQRHYHIHWIIKDVLDWEPFWSYDKATQRALQIAAVDEPFRIHEVFLRCPICSKPSIEKGKISR